LNNKNWRALIRMLRKQFATESTVEVRRCPMIDNGDLQLHGNTFKMRINSALPKGGQIDALIHEWAHVLAIEEAYRHEFAWGIAHAAVYSVWEAWDSGLIEERSGDK